MPLIRRPTYKLIICIWCKVLIKFQEVLHRNYLNTSRSIITKFFYAKKISKDFLLTLFITKNWLCFFSCLYTTVTFSLLIMFVISERKVALFGAVMWMFRASSTELFQCHFIFLLNSVTPKLIFSATLSASPLISTVSNSKHFLTWNILLQTSSYILLSDFK